MASHLALKATLDAIHFSGLGTLAKALMSGGGAILMLHRVRETAPSAFAPNSHLCVTPGFLDRLLSVLGREADFVSMDEAAVRIAAGEGGASTRPFLAITLDDGYRDNLTNAAPVFRRHDAPFTIFIAPGLVEADATLWWEDLEAAIAARDDFSLASPKGNVGFDVSTPALKRKAFAELLHFLTHDVSESDQRRIVSELCWQVGHDPKRHVAESIMNWSEIAALAKDPLCTIGAHTIHHYALARLPEKEARSQIVESVRIIEMELGERPRHFAYPYGYPEAAGPREFLLAREAGLKTAVTTRHGVVRPGHKSHLHALPRISVNGDFQRVRHVRTLLSGLPTLLANRGRTMNVG